MTSSPTPIADLTRFNLAPQEVMPRVEQSGARVWISGGPGSDRSTLERRLGERSEVVLVEPEVGAAASVGVYTTV